MSGERDTEFFDSMVRMEKMHAERLRVLAEKVKHPVMRALLLGIAGDSEKHALFYQAVIELISRYQPTLSQEEFKAMVEEIAVHIETERRMMEITRELLEKVGDSRVKLLIAAVHDDELKHHGVLLSIRDNIGSEYVVGEEDVWNAVWRDSPWHGTPGG